MLADSGEDAIAYSDGSDYAANVELAEALAPATRAPAPAEAMQKVPTPGQATCEDVAALLGLPLARTVKCLADRDAPRIACRCCWCAATTWATRSRSASCRGSAAWRWATEAEIVAATGCRPGYLGPVGIPRGHAADRRPQRRAR